MLGESQGLWLMGNVVDMLQGVIDHVKNMPSPSERLPFLEKVKMESIDQGHKYTLDMY